jgi:hypothetical protein
MRYNFFEAWPSKWKGFTLDGKGTDVAVEEIEFASSAGSACRPAADRPPSRHRR